jgi:hypothetical protein
MGMVRSMNGRDEECTHGFRWDSQKERDNQEDLDVSEKIILKWISEK